MFKKQILNKNTTENLDTIYNTSIRRLKSGEGTEWWGISGPKEQHSGEFPAFSLYVVYPRLGIEEFSNLEIPISTKFQQKLALSGQNTGKRNSLARQNKSTFQAITIEKLWSSIPHMPAQAKWVVWTTSLVRVGIRSSQVEDWNFRPCDPVTSSSPSSPLRPWYQQRPLGELASLDSHLHLAVMRLPFLAKAVPVKRRSSGESELSLSPHYNEAMLPWG